MLVRRCETGGLRHRQDMGDRSQVMEAGHGRYEMGDRTGERRHVIGEWRQETRDRFFSKIVLGENF